MGVTAHVGTACIQSFHHGRKSCRVWKLREVAKLCQACFSADSILGDGVVAVAMQITHVKRGSGALDCP